MKTLITKALVTALVTAGALYHPSNTVLAQDDTAEMEEPIIIPEPMREFRAAWVATVANIDWPSKPGLSTQQQQDEAIAILDRVAELNMNAIVFQARPQADALYESDLEPWSYYLTGAQGKAPDPYYDPLDFWVRESHKRGLEIHVWFNPYRAHHTAMKGEISEDSVVKKRPDLALELANGMRWLDPAQKEVQDISYNVMMDAVRRYDIDGVHFDDYFYPYDSYNDGKDFPDDASWEAYQKAGGELSRADWRRKAVNDFIQRLYEGIKEEKPHVKFGISPFGIWRPGNPPSIQGYDQYDKLYADAKLWLNEGWVDYFTPQLYWPIRQVPQSYPVLLAWWAGENTAGRNLWPGLYTGRTGGTLYTDEEIVNQIMVTRAIVPEGPGNVGPGHVHFSMKSFQSDDKAKVSMVDRMMSSVYQDRALVPASPWLDDEAPLAPKVETVVDGDDLVVTWAQQGDEEAFVSVVAVQQGGRWNLEILPIGESEFRVQTTGTVMRTETSNQGLDTKEVEEEVKAVTRVAVASVDRLGNMSEYMVVELMDVGK